MKEMHTINLQISDESYVLLRTISSLNNIDIPSQLDNLITVYLDTYKQILSDPAGKALLGVK